MRAFGLTLIFVLGIVAGLTWVTSTVTFLLTVAIFTLLAVALTYEPSKRSGDYYAASFRERAHDKRVERAMRPTRYDVFDEARPE